MQRILNYRNFQETLCRIEIMNYYKEITKYVYVAALDSN